MTMEIHCDAVREGPLAVGRDVLIVGEDNPRSAAPKFSLYPLPIGCSGHRLCSRILRLPFDKYVSIWRTNLCVKHWTIYHARERAEILARPGTPWTHVLLLGRNVAHAFKRQTQPWFDGWEWGGKRYLLIPHPSGRTREWNDVRNLERAEKALRAFAPHIDWFSLERSKS